MKKLFLFTMLVLSLLSNVAHALTVTFSPKPVGGTVVSSPAGINCGSGGTACSSIFAAKVGTVSFTATADPGYAIRDENGVAQTVVTMGPYITAISGETILPVTFIPPSTLTTTLTGSTGTGTLSASGGGLDLGIDCSTNPSISPPPISIPHGFNCSSAYIVDSTVAITASIDVNTYVAWTGCASTSGPSGEVCTVKMDAAKSVNAAFIARTVTVTKISTSNGTGTVISDQPDGRINCGSTCVAAFPADSIINLVAVPDANSTFAGWGGDASKCGMALSCGPIFKIGDELGFIRPASVTATFAPLMNTLNVSVAGSTGVGSLSASPAGTDFGIDCSTNPRVPISGYHCSTSYQWGTDVTITALPGNAASQIVSWTGCDSHPTYDTCLVKITSAKNVSAIFDSYTVTVAKTGLGDGMVTSSPVGSINCGATCAAAFKPWSTVNLTAVPDGNSVFVGWDLATQCGNASVCQITTQDGLLGPATVYANFEKAENTLFVSTAGSTATGKVLGNVVINCSTASSQFDICSGPIPRGSKVILEATPDAATNASTVTWTGCDRTDGLTCFLDNMISQTNINAVFNANYKVSFNSVIPGSLTGTTSQIVAYGASTTPVTVSSAPTHRSFFRWFSNVIYSIDNPLIVTNVTADMGWLATFASHAPTLTYPTLFDAYNKELRYIVTGVRLGSGTTKASKDATPEFIHTAGDTVILGGYDSSYTTQSGLSTVQGAIKVTGGKLVVDGVAIQ